MMDERLDRTVHADLGEAEIVRYDRAGKWYWEPKEWMMQDRRQITLDEAVQFVSDLSQWKAGRRGGRSFDKRIAMKFDPEGR